MRLQLLWQVNEVWLWDYAHLEVRSARKLLHIPQLGFIRRHHLCVCSSNPAGFWFGSVTMHRRVISNYTSKINNSRRFPDPWVESQSESGLCWWSQDCKIASTLLLSNYLIREVKPGKYGLPSGMAQFQLVKIVNYKMSPPEMQVGANVMYFTSAFLLWLSTLWNAGRIGLAYARNLGEHPPDFSFFLFTWKEKTPPCMEAGTNKQWQDPGSLNECKRLRQLPPAAPVLCPWPECHLSKTDFCLLRDWISGNELIPGSNTEPTITQSILRFLTQNIWTTFT